MPLDTKKRVIPFKGPSGGKLSVKTTTYVSNPVETKTTVYRSGPESFNIPLLQGLQITQSESHPNWKSRKSGVFKGDIGGPFLSYKRYCPSEVATGSTYYTWRDGPTSQGYPDGWYRFWSNYSGPIMPTTAFEWPTLEASGDSALNSYGTTAIARCSPSRPPVDLSTTIGELFHEGIPALIGGTLKTWRGLSARDRRRAIGKEYLNYEFGWKPLVDDLMGFAAGVIDANSAFQQYERNSGKPVRRSYDFPEIHSSSITKIGGLTYPYVSPSAESMYSDQGVNPLGQVYREDDISIRRWFRGAFSYYVPPISDDLTDEIARGVIYARKTLGISLTPETLWNLAPWSWAVDWFSSSGDVISNWTDWAIDNQVLLYGYIMEHQVHRRTYTYTGPANLRGGGYPAPLSLVVETKKRLPATPYGFGLSYDGFSTRQKAIITALGVSRSK